MVVYPRLNALNLGASEGLQFTLGTIPPPLPFRQLYTYNGTINDRPRYAYDCGLVLQLGQ
jgi:hypothetical protein